MTTTVTIGVDDFTATGLQPRQGQVFQFRPVTLAPGTSRLTSSRPFTVALDDTGNATTQIPDWVAGNGVQIKAPDMPGWESVITVAGYPAGDFTLSQLLTLYRVDNLSLIPNQDVEDAWWNALKSYVKTVNHIEPDENGDVELTVSSGNDRISTLPAIGQYFTSPFFLNLSSHDLLNAPANNALWIPLASPITVDSISINVTTAGAAGSVITVGLYADDGTGRPSAAPLGSGMVSIPTSATGKITAMLGAPIALDAPGVWVMAPSTMGSSAQLSVGGLTGPRMGLNTSLSNIFTVGMQENGNPANYTWTPMFVLHRSA